MYSFFLSLHSILRWLVVIAGVLAVGWALMGVIGRRPWGQRANRLGLLFVTSLDVQLLVGLILYFVLSPLTTSALSDFGGAMANPAIRYYAVEHIFLMLVAVVLAHVGRSLSKKAAQDAGKHRRALIFYGLAMAALLLAIPWPFLPNGRPWIRL